MSVVVAVPLFLAALAVTLLAAATFARRLDRLGAKYGLPEVWIGLLTAVAADGPEVSSALVALIKGAHDASVGVIVGSNTFNLAAMIGVSALIAGCVQVARNTLVLEGTVALAVTAIVIALLVGWLSPVGAVLAIACFLGPYLLLVLGGEQLANQLGLRRLATLVKDRDRHQDEAEAREHLTHEFVTHHQLALMAMDITLIVAGSYGMVQAALTLGDQWGITPGVVGALILGPLTSLPNALTGVRLGRARRGAALVTETLNSNTINLVAGVALPSLFVTLATKSAKDRLDLVVLAAAMVATVALLAPRKGMGRAGAALIVGLYAAFVAVTLS
jgi:cation:H+ antiporter